MKIADYLETFDLKQPDTAVFELNDAGREYLRMVLEFLEINRTRIGKSVLDIGCGNGLITCFVASMIPDSSVVGIDTDEKSVQTAQRLAEELGLMNVSFEAAGIDNYRYPADTVISSRNAAAYSLKYEKGIENASGEPLKKQAENYKKIFRRFAKASSKLALFNMFTFESLPFNGGYIGFCSAMNDAGLIIDPFYHVMAYDPEASGPDDADIQIAIFEKAEPLSTDKLIDRLVEDIVPDYADQPTGSRLYNGIDGDILLWNGKCSLVKGVYYYYRDKKDLVKFGKQAVYESPLEKDKIYLRVVFGNERDDLLELDAKMKDKLLDTLHNDIKAHTANGLIVKRCFV